MEVTIRSNMKKVIRKYKTGATIPMDAIYLSSKEETEAVHYRETMSADAVTATKIIRTFHYFIVFVEEEK